MVPIFSVVGRSNTGKTTFIRRLIGELKQRGYRVAVIKHDPEDHGEVDKKGSDTDLFFREGSDAVALSSPRRLALFRRVAHDTPPADIVSLCGSVDCVILEGYKKEHYPKIEIRMKEEDELKLDPEQLLAVVYSKREAEMAKQVKGPAKPGQPPYFFGDQLAGVADLLEKTVLSKRV